MAALNPQAILAWVELSQKLATLGIDATSRIRASISAMHPDADDAELDEAIRVVIDDATRRKALAERDSRGES
jgi:DNA-binding transcriptional regulator/RsmH inhibitor MraZ